MKLRDEASLGGPGSKHLGSSGNAQAWKVQDDEALLLRLEAEGQRALSHRLSSSRSKRPIKNGLSPWGSAIKVMAGALDGSGDPDGWTPRHSPSRGNAFTATTTPHVDKCVARGARRAASLAPPSARARCAPTPRGCRAWSALARLAHEHLHSAAGTCSVGGAGTWPHTPPRRQRCTSRCPRRAAAAPSPRPGSLDSLRAHLPPVRCARCCSRATPPEALSLALARR